MLAWKPVVVDFEGFNYKTCKFIVKELAVCGDYLDSFILRAPRDINSFTGDERRAFRWQAVNLHGLNWSAGDCSYDFLGVFASFAAQRYSKATFYAKGLEKCEFLSRLFCRPFQNLDDLDCPKVSELNCNTNICSNHNASRLIGVTNHCARKKAQLFYNWLLEREANVNDNNNNEYAEYTYYSTKSDDGKLETSVVQRFNDISVNDNAGQPTIKNLHNQDGHNTDQ